MTLYEEQEREIDRLTAALEAEKHFWEEINKLGLSHLTPSMVEQRLEALTAALEEK